MPDRTRRPARRAPVETAANRVRVARWLGPVVAAGLVVAVVATPGPAAATPRPAASTGPLATPPDGRAAAAGAPTAAGRGPGYALAESDGRVATFGGAGFQGDLGASLPATSVVGMAPTRDGGGYWLATRAGTVYPFGDARQWAADATTPGGTSPTVAIVADPAGPGYWLVRADGRIAGFGAPALSPGTGAGSSAGVTGAAAAAGGRGLWLLGRSGAVSSVGTVPAALQSPAPGGPPAVAIAATPDGRGYWTVSAAGRVATAGDATGSRAAGHLAGPVAALVAAPEGGGYLLVLGNGTVVGVGGAVNLGDARSPLHPPDYPAALQLPATDVVGGAYLAPGPQPSRTGPLRVTVVGDSVSVIVARYTQTYLATHHLDATVAIGGIMGCGITGNLPLATYSHPTPPAPTLPACGQWQQQYRLALATYHPDLVVVLLGYWESQLHRFGGREVTVATSPGYRAYLARQLGLVETMVRSVGARLLLVNTPYDGDGTPAANVDAFDALLASVAHRNGVPVFDLRQLLDPTGRYQPEVDGVVARNSDGVHPSVQAVTTVIDPALVPRLLALAHQPPVEATGATG